jgi:hypothetical protein
MNLDMEASSPFYHPTILCDFEEGPRIKKLVLGAGKSTGNTTEGCGRSR